MPRTTAAQPDPARVAALSRQDDASELAPVNSEQFTGRESYDRNLHGNQPFAFGFDVNMDGYPQIGNGSTSNLMQTVVTTRALLMRLQMAQSQTLHVDATFKLSKTGYSVIVVGVSDSARSFHLIAVFITSQLTAALYAKAMGSLMDEYKRDKGEAPLFYRVMTDADDALRNGLDNAFADRRISPPTYLMCFFHVMMRVRTRTAGLSNEEARAAKDIVYVMHMSASEEEFQVECAAAQRRCNTTKGLSEFWAYFRHQWIISRFGKWQAFRSPRSTANTNNPVEQFNRTIKRDYALRALLPASSLFSKLQLMARTKSTFAQAMASDLQPSAETLRRYRQLDTASLLLTSIPVRSSISFHITKDPKVVCVQQSRAHILGERRRTRRRTNYSTEQSQRMLNFEIHRQPQDGWSVNVSTTTCGCTIANRNGFCVHLVAACAALHRAIYGRTVTERFVDRWVTSGGADVGRPRYVGPLFQCSSSGWFVDCIRQCDCDPHAIEKIRLKFKILNFSWVIIRTKDVANQSTLSHSRSWGQPSATSTSHVVNF